MTMAAVRDVGESVAGMTRAYEMGHTERSPARERGVACSG